MMLILKKIPFAMRKLKTLSFRRNHDFSSMGLGDIDIDGPDDEGMVEGTTIISVPAQDDARIDDTRIDEANDAHLLTSGFSWKTN